MKYVTKKFLIVLMLGSAFQVKCSIESDEDFNDENFLNIKELLAFMNEEENVQSADFISPDKFAETDAEQAASAYYLAQSKNRDLESVSSSSTGSMQVLLDSLDSIRAVSNAHEKAENEVAQNLQLKDKKSKKKKKFVASKSENDVSPVQAIVMIELEEKAKKEEERRAQQRVDNIARVALEKAQAQKKKQDKRNAFDKKGSQKKQQKTSLQSEATVDHQEDFEDEVRKNKENEQKKYDEGAVRYRARVANGIPVISRQVQGGLSAEERRKQEVIIDGLRAADKFYVDYLLRSENPRGDCVIDFLAREGEMPSGFVTYVDADFFMLYFNSLIEIIKAQMVLINYTMFVARPDHESQREPVYFKRTSDILSFKFANYVISFGFLVPQEMYNVMSEVLQLQLDYIKELKEYDKSDVQARKDLKCMREILMIMDEYRA